MFICLSYLCHTFGALSAASTVSSTQTVTAVPELCHSYPYPCPEKFYKLHTVPICYKTNKSSSNSTNNNYVSLSSTNWLRRGRGYEWRSSAPQGSTMWKFRPCMARPGPSWPCTALAASAPSDRYRYCHCC